MLFGVFFHNFLIMNKQVFIILRAIWGIFIAISFTILVSVSINSNRGIVKETTSNLFQDIQTTDSIHLTLINPAFMTRQISELAEKKNAILYHITSLNPIRVKNEADGRDSH
jgi:hypothetical protein